MANIKRGSGTHLKPTKAFGNRSSYRKEALYIMEENNPLP